jgi:hypothetical protein
MYRTYVIVRHTFTEALVQPIYSLVLALAAGVLIIFGVLPFFTLGEDTKMFLAVGLDVVLVAVLISTLFATSRTVFDEIEDRTMLTLMSKPVAKWEVLVGKYLGIILATALSIAILGTLLAICLYLRIPGDHQIRSTSADDREIKQLADLRWMHIYGGLLPSLVLTWLQVSVLAAVGVALSTRFSLVVNLPVVIIIYIAGNLVRFLFPMDKGSGTVMADRHPIVKGIVYVLSLGLPFLQTFDLRPLTVYTTIKVAGTAYVRDPLGVDPSTLWSYVAISALYAATFSAFALSVGMWSFQGRELGGNEG